MEPKPLEWGQKEYSMELVVGWAVRNPLFLDRVG